MSSDLDQLVEMGFEKERAELAVKYAGNCNATLRGILDDGLLILQTVQGAVDWLDQNADKPLDDLKPSGAAEDGESSKNPIANSVVCEDCGKRFRSFKQFGAHAERTGHVNVTESAEELAALTEEQKKEKLAELYARRDAKHAEQSNDDKANRKRNEEIRRKSTKEQQDAKEDLQRKQQMKEAASKRREQQEEIAQKRRVQQRIKEDQENRRRKAEEEKARRAGQSLPTGPVEGSTVEGAQPTKSGGTASSKPASDYRETRLRLQTDRGTFQQSFDVNSCLQEVAAAATADKGVEVVAFQQNFPKKVFDNVDFGMTLKEAGLVPSAALIVKST